MGDLERLREKWLDLIKNQQISEAEKIYWEEMFPLIEKKFLEVTKINQDYDWLILPCGLEASYYILLIKAINPKNVYFIGTKEFKQSFLDKILEKTGLKASQYVIDTVEYEGMDVAEIYKEIRHHLDLFSGKKVVMDLTRGKRIMSAGAGIVGAFFGFDLVYIDEGWLDEIKRGMPGTEKLVMLKNPFDIFGDLEGQEAVDLFNNYNYGAAMFFFKKLREKIADPRRIEIEQLLAEVYLHWESFNFKAALNKLDIILRKMQQYNINIKKGNLEKNFEALKILNSSDITKPEELGDEFSLHLIIDLYVNAMRRAEKGRFEDSVSRLYRSLELISQYRLANYEIISSNPNLNKYEGEYKEITKQIYGVERELPVEIGVKDGHILLFLLKDYTWEGRSVEALKQFCGMLRVRDTSIIAHGLKLVGEKAFNNINSITKEFIEKICKNLNKDMQQLIIQHTFLKLDK